MYSKTISNVSQGALARVDLYESKGRFFVASMLAGAYVGLGIFLIFTISGLLDGAPGTKIAMGATFGVALSLVIMAGSELFTCNNFIMTVGSLNKNTSWKFTAESWFVCYLGNLAGAFVIAVFFVLAGLGQDSATGQALASAAEAKASMGAVDLFFRGILCNIMVCLAVLCNFKLENESAKLIIIWWCLFVFITAGFEHSIANMTLYFASIIGNTGITIAQMSYNLFWVTLGNMAGGILLGASYYYLGSAKKNA